VNLTALFGAIALAQPLPAAIEAPATAPQASPTFAAPVATVARLPALTPLRLRVEGEISSKTHVTGDKIVIILAESLRVTDTLAIPAGTRGVGEVVHSAKKGMGGKAGELLIAARTLDLAPGVSVPLRSFRIAPAKGKNQEGVATGLMVAGGAIGGIAAMVMTGGSALIPDGSEAFAKTAADIDLPLGLLAPIAGSAVPLVTPAPSNPVNTIQ
jgi:hypothetical protein